MPVMRGMQLCVGWNRETNENLEKECHGFSTTDIFGPFLHCQYATLAKYPRRTWSLLGAYIS